MSIVQKFRDYQPGKAALAWTAAGSIVLTMAVGFTAGGWVTGGTAQQMANQAAARRRVAIRRLLILTREQMQQEVARLLDQARREAQAISDRTTKAAEAAAAEIRREASAEGDRIRERARADAKQLHDQSLAQLRGEVASMAVLAASRILGKEVDVSEALKEGAMAALGHPSEVEMERSVARGDHSCRETIRRIDETVPPAEQSRTSAPHTKGDDV